MFSNEVDVRSTDSHSIFNADGERINHNKNILIGEDVWIGRMASILNWAVIGDSSIIGSKSLVSDTIPNEVIAAAGVSAKTIKENMSWQE